MKCYVHPEVDATGACTTCGRAICGKCGVEFRGRLVCRECLATGTALTTAGALEEEKTWATLAHASILLSLITGLGGLVAAAIIWLVKKDQSAYLARQTLQALVYQGVITIISIVLWAPTILLMSVYVGCFIAPFVLLIDLVAIGYGVYAAYACSQGREFSYAVIGDMVGAR